MTKVRYNPRNRNERIDANRQSWSTAFDDMIERRRADRESGSCGFQVKDGEKSE